MVKEKIIVNFKFGLNARVASSFLRNSLKFKSDIFLIKNGNRYNAKSILNILSMEACNKDEIEIEISGEDEKIALNKLIGFFNEN